MDAEHDTMSSDNQPSSFSWLFGCLLGFIFLLIAGFILWKEMIRLYLS